MTDKPGINSIPPWNIESAPLFYSAKQALLLHKKLRNRLSWQQILGDGAL